MIIALSETKVLVVKFIRTKKINFSGQVGGGYRQIKLSDGTQAVYLQQEQLLTLSGNLQNPFILMSIWIYQLTVKQQLQGRKLIWKRS